VAAPIIGATKMRHLEEAVVAAKIKLSAEEIEFWKHRINLTRPQAIRKRLVRNQKEAGLFVGGRPLVVRS
jgi:hypothetical protein